jgi:replicative DNA helicase
MEPIKTGFADLDRKIAWLHRGDLVVIGSRPAMGKTAFALNLSYNMASGKPSQKIAFFSACQQESELVDRLASSISEVPTEASGWPGMDEGQRLLLEQGRRDIRTLPIIFDCTARMTLPHIVQRSKNLRKSQGLDVVVIDYLQLLPAELQRESRSVELGDICRELKALARELDAVVIALSSMSRSASTRNTLYGQLSDLRDSGAIEDDCDVALVIHRPEVDLENERPEDYEMDKMMIWSDRMEYAHGRADLCIAKNRHGSVGHIDLQFEARFSRFLKAVKPWEISPA